MAHQFKKQFGQNFLRNDRFAVRMVESLNLQPNDVVIEIGPGDGRVTKLLLETGVKVICIEVDYDLIVTLIKRFNNFPNFEIVHEDVLRTETEELLAQFALGGGAYQGQPIFKVIGSLPYNISKQIIAKYLLGQPQPAAMAFIVQEEVAQDYTALAPQASFLSTWLTIYAVARKLESIPKAQFFPVPKVNGAILAITPRPLPSEEQKEAAALVQFVRLGFSAPRKTLWNNLRSARYPEEQLADTWVTLALSKTVRAAEMSVENWRALYSYLSKPGL